MSWFINEPINTRLALFGSTDDASNEIPRYDSNPFLSNEDYQSYKEPKKQLKLIKLFKSIGKMFNLKRKSKIQSIEPQLHSTSPPPDYETIVPARHVTTTLSNYNNNFFCIRRKSKSTRKRFLLNPSNSIHSSVNSIFENYDQDATGATTADSIL
ncbi:uncharacterized protein KGF55_004800 [Candida pseudojiufengensis]|uniref:uncharacterized protein n=1 Tax=Candida pseudojiufengensis TaxID=497109 RepID=UPI0022245BB9|nr:uncharacterized protein KGF55_004800 [Candida pseudojiufengensis]KAI5960077.1 hypothetical protein KGF55_004800 [Candida pseudojiufengensis]